MIVNMTFHNKKKHAQTVNHKKGQTMTSYFNISFYQKIKYMMVVCQNGI